MAATPLMPVPPNANGICPMHQAEIVSTTARRKFLAGIVALPVLAAGTGPVAAKTAPDCDLLKDCAAYHAITAEITALGYAATDDQLDTLVSEQWQLMKKIEAYQVKTLTGIKEKCRVIQNFLPDYIEDF